MDFHPNNLQLMEKVKFEVSKAYSYMKKFVIQSRSLIALGKNNVNCVKYEYVNALY